MWLDSSRLTLSTVDSARDGYLIRTLGQECIPNLLEFRILLQPTKPLCRFCIGVAASICGTNIFQHRQNYSLCACGAALTSQKSADNPLPTTVFVDSATGMDRRSARQCCHSCPDAVMITTSCCPLPRRRGCVTGLSLAAPLESGVETDLFGGTSVALI